VELRAKAQEHHDAAEKAAADAKNHAEQMAADRKRVLAVLAAMA
jgi:hypothetical protein